MYGRLMSFVAMIGLSVAFAGGGVRDAFSEDSAAAAAAVKAAQAEAESALSAHTEWNGPTEAPKPQAGKRVAIVSCNQASEGCNRPTRSAKEAAEKIGWIPTVLDGQGDIGKQLTAVNAAVDGKYDAILLILTDPAQVNEGVQRALDAHIPMVTLGEPAFRDSRKALSAIPDISHDWLKTGEYIGDYMIWKSNGNIDALLLNDPEVPVVTLGQFAGTKSKLTDPKVCPDCKIKVENFTDLTLPRAPAALTAAAVQSDPKINWVWCFDMCMAHVVNDLVSRGLQGNVSGAGFDCNAQNLQLIKDDKVQRVCIADPRDWEAWATVDTANRLMQGSPIVPQNIPVRLFDKSNVGDLTPQDLKDGWQGGVDYKAHYLKMWGVQ